MRRPYRWLLFDADNTLFDFTAAEEVSISETLRRFGLPDTLQAKDLYKAVNSQIWREFEQGTITQEALRPERFARFLDALGLPGDANALNLFYTDALSRCPFLLPGAEALCRDLSHTYGLALITNGIDFVQRGRLGRSPLGPYFAQRVYISGEMGHQKPEGAFFQQVLDDLRAAPQECLVIGDSLSSDIRGARNAGLDSVWYAPNGGDPGPDGPTFQVSSFSELAELLL